jgi:hypothetical protein
VRKKGGLPTTLFLRHRNRFLPAPTRERYHSILKAHGLKLPTALQERKNPEKADEYYRSVIHWLLEKTRGPKFSMLLGENIDYGSRRNLLGLKPFGLIFALVALFANALLLFRSYGIWNVTVKAGWASLIALFIIALIWLFKINLRWVDDASENYAVRLLAQLENLSPPKRIKRK